LQTVDTALPSSRTIRVFRAVRGLALHVVRVFGVFRGLLSWLHPTASAPGGEWTIEDKSGHVRPKCRMGGGRICLLARVAHAKRLRLPLTPRLQPGVTGSNADGAVLTASHRSEQTVETVRDSQAPFQTGLKPRR
jgi:hypothetical protein